VFGFVVAAYGHNLPVVAVCFRVSSSRRLQYIISLERVRQIATS
jgi:hypothetical protein